MQTFLPYSDFGASARVLDRQRLGKQRVETLQIMTALFEDRGWIHHPATLMWKGYEHRLMMYQHAICVEWVGRGYKDTCLGKTWAVYSKHSTFVTGPTPPWLGDLDFHISHQSNLLRKDEEHYRKFFPDVPTDIPYHWPISKEE